MLGPQHHQLIRRRELPSGTQCHTYSQFRSSDTVSSPHDDSSDEDADAEVDQTDPGAQIEPHPSATTRTIPKKYTMFW